MKKETKTRNLIPVLLPSVLAALIAQAVHAGPITPDNRFNLQFEPDDQLQRVDNLIVKYKAGSPATGRTGAITIATLQRASRDAGVAFSYQRKMSTGAQLLRLPSSVTLMEAKFIAQRIAVDQNVEYVEPDQMLQPVFTPNDPRYAEQWHYHETIGGIRAPQAWDITRGAGAVVAVVDTGYRPHTDLAANILQGYDFITSTSTANDGNGRDSDAQDPGDWAGWFQCPTIFPTNSSWHGTHVAGTIAALTDNSLGVAGIAHQARVVPARVLGRCGGSLSDIADAITWSSGGSVAGVPANANPADVINMSLGGSGACSATLQSVINGAVTRGTVVVVAAGNSNANVSGFMPANCNNVVAVAATNRAGSRASYSNYGALIDLAAPGGETSVTANGVLSTLNAGTRSPGADSYKHYQGTSMAAPHVAGVAALMFSVKPTLTPATAESLLRSSARAFPGTCSQCGTGIVDANAAVLAAQASP